VAGPLVAAAGFALFARPPFGQGGDLRTNFPANTVHGHGMAVTVAPLTTTVMNAADTARAGLASGVNNAVSRVASLLAGAAFGVVMGHAFDHALRAALATHPLPPAAAESMWAGRQMLGALQPPGGLDPATAKAARQAVAAAFTEGFGQVMAWCALLAVLSAGAAAACIRGGRGGRSAGTGV
jgi:hypothetical protein